MFVSGCKEGTHQPKHVLTRAKPSPGWHIGHSLPRFLNMVDARSGDFCVCPSSELAAVGSKTLAKVVPQPTQLPTPKKVHRLFIIHTQIICSKVSWLSDVPFWVVHFGDVFVNLQGAPSSILYYQGCEPSPHSRSSPTGYTLLDSFMHGSFLFCRSPREPVLCSHPHSEKIGTEINERTRTWTHHAP